MDEYELLRRYAERGDEAAFAAIVDRYLGKLYGVAYRRTGDRLLAEEIAQDVFTALAKKAPSMDANTVLACWLHRATALRSAHVLRSEYRRQRKMRDLSEANLEGPPASPKVEDDLLSILDQAVDQLDEQDRADNWYFELLSRWAKEDAAAALDFARSELSGSNQYQGLCGLFEHLAKSDAQGAFIQWGETRNQLENPKNAQGSLLAIMGQWWTKDLDAAMSAIQSLEDPSDRFSALNGCFGDSFVNASASDKERLLMAIKVLPDEGNRNHGLSAYASALARNRSLEEIVTWIEDQELKGEAAASAERGAAGEYLTRDPNKAAQWLGERATAESLSEHLKYVVIRWAMHEPNAVGKWLGTFEVSRKTDDAMEAYANTIAHDDIESAFYWGQNIQDPERRFQALTRYAKWWAREDPGAVAGTISRSSLTPEQQAELLSRVER